MAPAPLRVTRLLVLRHGQSEWNAQNRWQGHADIPLDDVGRTQAREAGERVGGLGEWTAIWASDLRRAMETAEIVAAVLGLPGVHVDPRLRENDVGPWEGLDREAVEAGWPGYLAARLRPEGFEAYDDAAARMRDSLLDLAGQHQGEDVLIVGHGGITRATRRSRGAEDGHLPNLAGCWFTAADGGLAAGEIIALPARDALPASEVL